jgi:hypothetical protein
MATSATMREMFERLGFTPGAASSLEGNDHGINTLEEVVFLNDKDIDSLVEKLRRSGGMIAGPTIVDLWLLILVTPCPSGLRLISSWKCFTCAIKPGFQELCRLQALH